MVILYIIASKQFSEMSLVAIEGLHTVGISKGGAIQSIIRGRVNLFPRFRETLRTSQPEKRFNDWLIVEVCDLYERLFGHLDAIFSIAGTKRFHLTADTAKKGNNHLQCLHSFGAVCRCPQLQSPIQWRCILSQ